MSIPVFYRPEQSCAEANSYSPSAGKPALVVADWLQSGLIAAHDIMTFEPLEEQQFAPAHSLTYTHCMLRGQFENGFGNNSLAIADSLRYTNGSLLAAAEYAVLHNEHTCSPTSGFHHAGHNSAEGFCTFNGLMISAMALHKEGLVQKVGILDIDAHEGNGTNDIIQCRNVDFVKHHTFGGVFHSRKDCSDGKFEEWLRKACDDLKDCDVILYQAGADPHVSDPLGGCLTTEQMRFRDAYVFSAFKGTPLCWCLAGGYQRDAGGGIEPVLALHRQTMVECLKIFQEDEKKNYTFSVSVGCSLAVTFTRKELQQWPDGREGELEPKDAVMERLEKRLTELIGQEFEPINRINVYTDGDLLLHVED